MKQLYPQSQTVQVLRSAINFAPFNPKIHSKAQVELIRKNIKKVGLLGGIIWNEHTGNLVDGHKRVMSLDILHKYPESDYELKVEKVNFDLKTEKEQNIFQTMSRSSLDDELLRDLLPDIAYLDAGLCDADLEYLGYDPNPELGETIVEEMEAVFAPIAQENAQIAQEKKEAVKATKQAIMEKAVEKTQNATAYVTLSFSDAQGKMDFMEAIGERGDVSMVKGERVTEHILG